MRDASRDEYVQNGYPATNIPVGLYTKTLTTRPPQETHAFTQALTPLWRGASRTYHMLYAIAQDIASTATAIRLNIDTHRSRARADRKQAHYTRRARDKHAQFRGYANTHTRTHTYIVQASRLYRRHLRSIWCGQMYMRKWGSRATSSHI